MLLEERTLSFRMLRGVGGAVGEEMDGIYSGRRMGGQLVFFNVTVRGTLPCNYSLSHSSSTLYTFYCLSYSWLGSGKGRIEYMLGGREVRGERLCGGLLGHMQRIDKSK
jgi:hypothetical protein